MSKEKTVDKVEKKQEDWMTKKWRPMMAVMYMVCCLMDFAVFPIMFTIVQFWETAVQNDAFRQWAPITLQGGGLFHVAMGAVLGVSAYGRTQEKVAGVAGGSAPAPAISSAPSLPSAPIPVAAAPSTYVQPTVTRAEPVFSPPPEPAPQVVMGYGGKPAPVPAPQPLL